MGTYMPRAGRDRLRGKKDLPHEVLRAAQNQLGAVEAGPMVPWSERADVYVKVLNIRPADPRPGTTPPDDPFHISTILKRAGPGLDATDPENARTSKRRSRDP